jgi:hypothetical protein
MKDVGIVWVVVLVLVAYEYGRGEIMNAAGPPAGPKAKAPTDGTTAAGVPTLGAGATNPQGSSAFAP